MHPKPPLLYFDLPKPSLLVFSHRESHTVPELGFQALSEQLPNCPLFIQSHQ